MSKALTNQNEKAMKPADRIKAVVTEASVREQFKNAMNENSNLFVASLIDLYVNNQNLQSCPASLVVAEALKAATLKLPLNSSLGFAYIVPYKNKPQFQIGYKGLVQLAMRSGQYKTINADVVYGGELKGRDKLSGDVDLSGEKTSDEVLGYFAYFKLLNGFEKTVYMSKQDVINHGKKFSASYSYASSPWKTDFDSMALKTVIKKLLGKSGVMSIEMLNVVGMDDNPDPEDLNERVNNQVDGQAGQGDYSIDDPPPQGEKKKAAAKKAAGKKAASKKAPENEPPVNTCDNDKCDNNAMGSCSAGFVQDGDDCKAYSAGPQWGGV